MGNKVALIDKVYTRLLAAIAPAQTLAGVKRVRVGSIEEARKLDDYPIINIQLTSGNEIFVAQPNQKIDNMNIVISLFDNKKDGVSSIYNTTTSTGLLYLLEKLLNTLESDLDFAKTAKDYGHYDYQINEYQNLVEAHISLTLPTANFTAGAR